MNPCKIIIVEDDEVLLENIERFFGLNGFDTTGVSTAAAFFEAAKSQTYDVAILDICLPDQNDFSISKYLREQTNTRIIILTARDSIEDKVSGYSSGADAYFVKPVDSWELKSCIESILSRNKQANLLHGQQAATNTCWKYDSMYLELTAPSGKKINLTTKEDVLLSLLIAYSGETVHRTLVFDGLNQAEGLNYDDAALDILVARLRKRVKEKTQETLPVRTIRSVGYCFYAPVERTRS